MLASMPILGVRNHFMAELQATGPTTFRRNHTSGSVDSRIRELPSQVTTIDHHIGPRHKRGFLAGEKRNGRRYLFRATLTTQ